MNYLEQLLSDESIDVILALPDGPQRVKSLAFNLATSGRLDSRSSKDRQLSDLAEIFDDPKLQNEHIAGWLEIPLSMCGEIYNGNSTSVGEKVAFEKNDHGLNYIATKDVSYGFQPIHYDTGLRVGANEKNFKVAPKDSVLICLEGGSAGKKIGIVEQDICFGNKLFAVVCKEWLRPRFLLMYFLSSKFQSDFRNQMSGIIGGISKGKFGELTIPIPPLAEQDRIIQKVDLLAGICDELEESKANLSNAVSLARGAAVEAISSAQTPEMVRVSWGRIENNWEILAGASESVESLRDLILSLAVSGKLTIGFQPKDTVQDLLQEVRQQLDAYPDISEERFSIPAHWAWVPLASVVDHQLGKMLNTAKMNGVPRKYLRSVNVRPGGRIDLTDLKEMLIPKSELDKYSVKKGDIFVNEGGDVGRNATFDLDIDFNLAFQNQLHRLRPALGIEGRYVQFVLRQAKSQNVIANMSSGVTIQHFSASAIRRFAVPLPPKSEQLLIVKNVNMLLSLCDQLEQNLDQVSSLAGSFASSVLAVTA